MTVGPDGFFAKVLLQCEAKVGGETLEVQQEIVAYAYDSSEDLRDLAHRQIRQELMLKILERWTPIVRIRR